MNDRFCHRKINELADSIHKTLVKEEIPLSQAVNLISKILQLLIANTNGTTQNRPEVIELKNNIDRRVMTRFSPYFDLNVEIGDIRYPVHEISNNGFRCATEGKSPLEKGKKYELKLVTQDDFTKIQASVKWINENEIGFETAVVSLAEYIDFYSDLELTDFNEKDLNRKMIEAG